MERTVMKKMNMYIMMVVIGCFLSVLQIIINNARLDNYFEIFIILTGLVQLIVYGYCIIKKNRSGFIDWHKI